MNPRALFSLCFVSVFASNVPGDPTAALDAAKGEFERSYGTVKSGAVRSPLESERAFPFTHDSEARGRETMRVEYYPAGSGRMVIDRLQGTASAVKAAAREFANARKTLEPMTPLPGLQES